MPTASESPTEIFTKLFAESRHALQRYIRRFVGSSETAKEIVQEAFLRTYRQRDSVTTLRAFLFSTARNLAANEYRHRRITERGTMGDFGDSRVNTERESLEAELLRDERNRLIQEAIDRLRVRAGDYWVRAVGTAFNVYLRPTGVEVTVSEGTVKVVNATANEPPPSDAAITGFGPAVTAGEQADVHDRAEVIRELNSAQISRLLAWRKSSLYFQDQPLGEVVNELMRYTTLKIVFDDDALRSLPVGGTFQTSPDGVEALLTMLHDGFGTTIRRDDQGHVYIEGPAK